MTDEERTAFTQIARSTSLGTLVEKMTRCATGLDHGTISAGILDNPERVEILRAEIDRREKLYLHGCPEELRK